MRKLILPTLRTFLIGVVILGVLLFIPAGTLDYWQAWLFILVFLVSANAIGVYLSLNDPALLERRKKVGPGQETNLAQKIIMSIAMLGLLAMLVVPALDRRFGWSSMPAYISVAGDILLALSFYIHYLVFRENSFGGSTIETFDSQKVISTGPYARVRHPMYGGVLVMCVSIPLALGSWWGLVVVALTVPVLAWRILDEEKLLRKDLDGYSAYAQTVRYRLVPHLW